jgi:hypothetical protein
MMGLNYYTLWVTPYTVVTTKLEQSCLALDVNAAPFAVPVMARAQLSALHFVAAVVVA